MIKIDMETSYRILLHGISVINSDLGSLKIKAINVSHDFYNYLAAKHKNNEFVHTNTVSYLMGVPVVIDHTIAADEHFTVQF